MSYNNNYSGNGSPHSHYLEDENELMTTQLRGKVKSLKSLTIDIGNEVRTQNRMLGEMDDDFHKSDNLLARSIRRVGNLAKGFQNYNNYILVLFVIFVFVLLWLALKFR